MTTTTTTAKGTAARRKPAHNDMNEVSTVTTTTTAPAVEFDIDPSEQATDRYVSGVAPIYWRNGRDKAARKPGFFYAAADDLAKPPTAPWERVELYDGEVGYIATRLTITVIGLRSQWFLESNVGGARKTWLTTYEQGARKLVEILALVSGIEEPVAIHGKGMIGAAWEDILRRYERGVLRFAEVATGVKPLPRWALSIPIASALDDRGKTLYKEFDRGGSITPPAAAWPVEAEQDDLVRLFWNDKETRSRCKDIRAEYDEWLNTKRGADGASGRKPYTPMEQAALPDPPSHAAVAAPATGIDDDLF